MYLISKIECIIVLIINSFTFYNLLFHDAVGYLLLNKTQIFLHNHIIENSLYFIIFLYSLVVERKIEYFSYKNGSILS